MKVPEKYYDEIFDYAGQWEIPSKCGLKIFSKNKKTYVVVTELYQDNPGTSVTAAGGLLAEQIGEKKGLNITDVIYLECNPDTHSKLSFYDEEFFQVIFTEENGKLVCLRYRQLRKEEIEEIFSAV